MSSQIGTNNADDRTRYIEVLQVLSVLAIPLAFGLAISQVLILQIAAALAVLVAIGCFAWPLMLIRDVEPAKESAPPVPDASNATSPLEKNLI